MDNIQVATQEVNPHQEIMGLAESAMSLRKLARQAEEMGSMIAKGEFLDAAREKEAAIEHHIFVIGQGAEVDAQEEAQRDMQIPDYAEWQAANEIAFDNHYPD